MDPENLCDVITSFQDKCREAISRYDGYIARYMDDGMLVYFGYPQAHETTRNELPARDSTLSAQWRRLTKKSARGTISNSQFGSELPQGQWSWVTSSGKEQPKKPQSFEKHRIWRHDCKALPCLTNW